MSIDFSIRPHSKRDLAFKPGADRASEPARLRVSGCKHGLPDEDLDILASPVTACSVVKEHCISVRIRKGKPKWRNWQTRYVQVVVGVTPWRFESSLGHQVNECGRPLNREPALSFTAPYSLNVKVRVATARTGLPLSVNG
jgi:hypothetical protein